jgi:hypothetical protein
MVSDSARPPTIGGFAAGKEYISLLYAVFQAKA